MKRKMGVIILSIIVIVMAIKLYEHGQQDIVSKLDGTLFYTRRDEGILKLYTSDADLEHERLIYSHQGKGKGSQGGDNDNIIDFYYSEQEHRIYFQAMHEGKWTIFALEPTGKEPIIVDNDKQKINPFEAHHLKKDQGDLRVFSKMGSMYLIKDGNTKLLKKYYGIYDEKFASGYRPVGFSPEGKYVIYHAMGHLSPVGTLLEAFVEGIIGEPQVGSYYIMDLENGETNRYMRASDIQWIK